MSTIRRITTHLQIPGANADDVDKALGVDGIAGGDVKRGLGRTRRRARGPHFDGAYGTQSQAVCPAFQEEKGPAADGILALEAWAAPGAPRSLEPTGPDAGAATGSRWPRETASGRVEKGERAPEQGEARWTPPPGVRWNCRICSPAAAAWTMMG